MVKRPNETDKRGSVKYLVELENGVTLSSFFQKLKNKNQIQLMTKM